MLERISKVLIGLLLVTDCFADEQRIQTKFESKNGQYSVQYKRSKWNLMDRSGSIKYKFHDEGFISMTIFVSDNGENIVVIDDFMEGHRIGDRKAVWIFNKGNLSQSYSLKDLLSDTCNTSTSIWRRRWCIEDFGFVDNQNKFSVSTYELTDFTFKLTTGQISNRKPAMQDSETLIVFGEFRILNGEQATMKIERYITGGLQKENTIAFKTKYYGSGRWREVLMIKEGVDVTPNKYRGKIFINNCLIQ